MNRVVHDQLHRYATPWSTAERLRVLAWRISWNIFCRWTPKPLTRWRLMMLRMFGCNITGRPFVSQSAKIYAPWRLTLKHKSCIASNAEIYNLGNIEIGERAVVAQQAYLCGGSHDFADAKLPLITAPIVLNSDCFIGARAIVLLGVTIGEGAVVGAGAVVVKDVEPWMMVAGNPAKTIKRRELNDASVAK